MCYFELMWLVNENAVKEVRGFFFKPQDKEMDTPFLKLSNDDDVMKMIKSGEENGNVFDIYCDHGVQTEKEFETRDYNRSGRTKNVEDNLTDVGEKETWHQVNNKPEEGDNVQEKNFCGKKQVKSMIARKN